MPLELQYKADLTHLNSLSAPAFADVLAIVSDVDALKEALQLAANKQWPLLVLGEGSNTVLQSDVTGLVIINRVRGVTVLENTDSHVVVKVAAGENWHALVESSVSKGWYGLENLALIPGAVGAAPIQNIGAYGAELSDTLVEVEYFDTETLQACRLDNSACEFAYRDSVFKHALFDRAIITSVSFRLSKRANCMLSYPALAERLAKKGNSTDSPTPIEVFNAVCEIRAEKLPLPSTIPNVGSFFKNPVISVEAYAKLLEAYPDLISFEVPQGVKLAAGWMIEKAGWKSRAMNGISVHQQQALVIVNPQHRTGNQVLEFAEAIRQDILSKFGVRLEIEPRVY